MKIGVFDSGIGGLSVANAIKVARPDDEVIFRHDGEHLPYGTKTVDEIYGYCSVVLQQLVLEGCAVIVVACNTVTTNLIDRLRAELSVPLVGVEPMVKTASEITTNKKVAVCATPRTLASERYTWLKNTYGPDVQFMEPDCSDWSVLIEANDLNKQRIEANILPCLAAGADVIVLGCTHYHWIEEDMLEVANGRATVLQPEQSVIAQLDRVISRL